MNGFTIAIMEEYWHQYSDISRPAPEIIKSLGFDIDLLGEIKAKGVYVHIREKVNACNGFRESGDNHKGIRSLDVAFGNGAKVSPNQAILRLEHES